MKKPLVSIIVPIYNVNSYLPRSLKSLINQSLENIEIILIDDGSTDNSLAICKDFLSQDSRIKLIEQSNLGVSAARNVGIEIAAADYIAFMDPDDDVDSRMYELLYIDARSNNYDVVLCNYYRSLHNENERVSLKYSEQLNNKNDIYSLVLEMIANPIYGDPSIMGSIWRGIYKKDIILKHNIRFQIDIRPMQDLIFMTELLLKCESIYINESYLYYYFINPSSAVTGYKPNLWDNNRKVCYFLQNIIEQNHLESIGSNHLVNLWIGCAEDCLHNELHQLNDKKVIKKISKINDIINDLQIRKYLNCINLKGVRIQKKFIINLMKLRNPLIIFFYLVITKQLRKAIK